MRALSSQHPLVTEESAFTFLLAPLAGKSRRVIPLTVFLISFGSIFQENVYTVKPASASGNMEGCSTQRGFIFHICT